MKTLRYGIFFIFFFLLIALEPSFEASSRMFYAEQFYSLYHQNLKMKPLDHQYNIHILEKALRSPMGHPRFALAKIEDPQAWQKYRALFYMHVNLLLLKEHIAWGSKLHKEHIYFHDAPFSKAFLENLQTAEELYRRAATYWPETLRWAQASQQNTWIDLKEIQYWQDEAWRIQEKELDYRRILQRHLKELDQSRNKLMALSKESY